MKRKHLLEKVAKRFGLVTVETMKSYIAAEEIYDFEREEGKAQPVSNYDLLKTYSTAVWVYAAVWAIANSGAAIPYKLYKLKNGERTGELKDHPAINLLNKPNHYMSYFDLIEASLTYLELVGNGYWQLDHPESSKTITSIYCLRPDKVKSVPGKEDLIDGYKYKPGVKNIPFEPWEIIRFQYFNPMSEFYGLSATRAADSSIISDFNAIAYNKNIFKLGRLMGYLKVDQDVDKDIASRLSREWEQKYSGPRPERRIAVLGKGAEFKEAGRSQKDMEFMEQRKTNREEILAAFGVPPIMVGLLRWAAYSNAREQKRTFYKDTLIPKMKKVEYGINCGLIWPFFGEDLEFVFDYSDIDVLKEDMVATGPVLVGLVSSDIITVDEARAKLGLGAREGVEKEAEGEGGDGEDEEAEITDVKLIPKEDQGSDKIDDIAQFQDNRKRKEKDNYQFWQKVTLLAERQEKPFKKMVMKEFGKVEREVLDNIKTKIKKQTITADDLIYDEGKFKKTLIVASAPIYLKTVSTAGSGIMSYLKVDKAFNVKKKAVREFLKTKPIKFADYVNETTVDRLRNTLVAGLDAGEGRSALTGRVQEVFKGTVRGEAPRAGLIAETEVGTANNFGMHEAYKQGGVKQKEWLSSFDEKTRPNHLFSSGQIVGIDEPFSVGGENLMYPRDPAGSAGNILGCRCEERHYPREE